ncbi:hypothetical protein EDB19DRAFT_1714461 [Suillus lakei]|nr:hypothetical protein EDB19DRAFT_1714461 [Suillus lakei]
MALFLVWCITCLKHVGHPQLRRWPDLLVRLDVPPKYPWSDFKCMKVGYALHTILLHSLSQLASIFVKKKSRLLSSQSYTLCRYMERS